MVEAWQPATELEGRMRGALNSGDQESYFGLLAETELVIPVPPDLVDDILANRVQAPWPAQEMDGRTHVLAFTSPEAMRACIGSGVQHFMRLKYADIAGSWPEPEWWLVVNLGLPIQAVLPAWFVRQAADGDTRPPQAGLTAPLTVDAHAAPARPEAPAREPAPPENTSPNTAAPEPTPQVPTAQDHAAQNHAAQDLTPQDLTAQNDAAQDLTAQDLTAQDLTAQDLTAQDLTAQDTTAADAPEQNATAEDTGTQDAPPESVPEQIAADGAPAPNAASEGPSEPDGAPGNARTDDTPPTVAAEDGPAAGPPVTERTAAAPEAPPAPAPEAAPPAAAGPSSPGGLPSTRGLSPAGGHRHTEGLVPTARTRPAGDFRPANDVERELLRAGLEDDKDAFIRALIGTEVLLLVPAHTDPTRRPGRPGFPWQPTEVDGENTIALFTSPERMLEVLGVVPGPGSTGTADFMKFPFASVIRYWPDRRWGLALNPGTKVGASLGGEQLLGLAVWADQMAAQRLAQRFEPQNDLERRLFEAATRRDTDAFFKVLQTAQVMMPADPETPWGIQPGDPGFPWRPVPVQGENSIQMFTSLKWMHDAIGPSRYIMPNFADIVSAWPDTGWTLVLNPGAPIDATVAGEQVAALRPAPAPEAEPAREAPVPPAPAAAEQTLPPEPQPLPLPEFEPGNRTDQELYEAALAGDTDAFLRVLMGANVLVPIPADAPLELTPMDARFQWEAALRDPSSVHVFTSLVQLHQTFGGAAAEPPAPEPRFVYADFRDLIGCWPHAEWTMLLNPGTRIGASLRGDQVQALSEWAVRVGLIRRPDAAVPQPRTSPSEPSPVHAAPVETPAPGPGHQPSVMQKVLPHGHVPWYLDQGYDRIGGFVHLASDVADLQTPAQLYEVLGLLNDGTAFSPDDEGVYVIRWTAHCGGLYRIPFGGQNEEEMTMWGDAGWVVEQPPFHGDGFAPGSAGTIREYKVDSVRLPYGAEMYYLGRDRSERFVAVYDPDLLTWLRPEDDPAAGRGERTEATQ